MTSPKAEQQYQMVPVEPTQLMIDHATSATSGNGAPDHDYDDDVREHWKAMLAAAPKSPGLPSAKKWLFAKTTMP